MRVLPLVAAILILATPLAAAAADAAHPYSNVNRRVDAGNNTGDMQVDGLNQAQLGSPGVRPRNAVQASGRAGQPYSAAP